MEDFENYFNLSEWTDYENSLHNADNYTEDFENILKDFGVPLL